MTLLFPNILTRWCRILQKKAPWATINCRGNWRRIAPRTKTSTRNSFKTHSFSQTLLPSWIDPCRDHLSLNGFQLCSENCFRAAWCVCIWTMLFGMLHSFLFICLCPSSQQQAWGFGWRVAVFIPVFPCWTEFRSIWTLETISKSILTISIPFFWKRNKLINLCFQWNCFPVSTQVQLICNCEKAIKDYHNLYEDLMWALEAQLWEIQEDFLADIVTNNNSIYAALRKLFKAILSPDNDMEPRLKTRTARFAERLTEKLAWDFSDIDEEEDDEKPVIVDL